MTSKEERRIVGQPVVHFEIIGTEPRALRDFYGKLFDWKFEVGNAASPTVSADGNYGFVDGATSSGVNGGVGGGDGYERQVLFYVGVPDVEAALTEAERLGGTRVMGPEGEKGKVVVGQFIDPEGNLIGVAGTQ